MNRTNHKQKRYIFKDRMTQNKSGSAYWMIYTMMFLFILSILYIIFGQILNVYIYPTTEYLSDGDTTAPDKFLSVWGWVPYMIVLIIGLFAYFKLTQTGGAQYG